MQNKAGKGERKGGKHVGGMNRFTNFSNGSSFLASVVHCSPQHSSPKPRPGSPPSSDPVISSVTQAETWHLMLGWNFFSFPPGAEEVEKTLRQQAKQQRPQPPLCFFSCLLPPVCLARPSHESDRSRLLWPLYRHKDSIEMHSEREREGGRERASERDRASLPLITTLFLQPCTSSLFHPLLFLFFFFFFFNFLLSRVAADPPPSWSYNNVTNHNSVSWGTQDHLGPWLASWLWTSQY